MKRYLCLLTAMFLTGCAVVPVPVDKVVLEGQRFTGSELEFVRPGTTARQEVIHKLGDPTIWLARQRILVYGIRQVESGVLWLIGAGPTGAGGLVEGETREAVYLVLDDADIVTHWGRAPVERGETWLSAATDWARSQAIGVSQARDRFVEETPVTGQSLVYFYRPRDYQHFLPLAPPADKLLGETANYADLRQDGKLVGQLRWRSYVVVPVPPGTHSFEVDGDTDDVGNSEIYRSATIRLDIAPDTVTFVDVGIQAGLGTIEPVLVKRPRSEAITLIVNLRESW